MRINACNGVSGSAWAKSGRVRVRMGSVHYTLDTDEAVELARLLVVAVDELQAHRG